MTGDGTYTYQWDAEGRLISVDNGAARSYVYNALGREVEFHGDGRVSEDLTDLAGQYLGSVDPSSGAWTGERIPGSSIYLAWYVNGGTTFFHYNALGSTVMNTRHDGTVTNDILFYPWGQGWAAPVNDYIQFFGNIPNWDWEIGEGVTPNRYYPNNQGRWLSPDPLAGNISNPQSLNRYAYVLNNPTTLNDPTGLSDCGNTDYPCNNYNGEPPVGGGHYNGNGGGTTIAGGADTDPSDLSGCSNLATNGAQCADYAGLWSNGQPIYGPPQVGGDSVGSWLGGGGGVWNEVAPPFGGGTAGLPCDFGTCGGTSAPPGNGFEAAEVLGTAGTLIAPGVGTTIGIVLGLGVDAYLAYKLYNIHQAKGGASQNPLPSWVTDRPRPGETADEFAGRVCQARYPPDGAGCGQGAGSEFNKIRKWAQEWINKHK